MFHCRHGVFTSGVGEDVLRSPVWITREKRPIHSLGDRTQLHSRCPGSQSSVEPNLPDNQFQPQARNPMGMRPAVKNNWKSQMSKTWHLFLFLIFHFTSYRFPFLFSFLTLYLSPYLPLTHEIWLHKYFKNIFHRFVCDKLVTDIIIKLTNVPLW